MNVARPKSNFLAWAGQAISKATVLGHPIYSPSVDLKPPECGTWFSIENTNPILRSLMAHGIKFDSIDEYFNIIRHENKNN